MHEWLTAARNRRAVLTTGLIVAGAAAMPAWATGPSGLSIASGPSTPLTSPKVVRPELLRRALAALDRHAGQIERRDRIAIADFAAPSREARFHFVDLATGKSQSMLVAHGSG